MSQYFDNNQCLNDIERKIDIKFNDKIYSFKSNTGLFSKNKFDFGSKLLLQTISKNNLSGKLLDLGCGYGPIGLILAQNNKQLYVDMVDVTDRAIKYSKINKELMNVKNVDIYISDIYSNIHKKYNYIVTNPPIRAGKDIVRKFLFGAGDYLEDNGELWFVMRKDHGVKSIIHELDSLFVTSVLEKSKGFYIVRCKIKTLS